MLISVRLSLISQTWVVQQEEEVLVSCQQLLVENLCLNKALFENHRAGERVSISLSLQTGALVYSVNTK